MTPEQEAAERIALDEWLYSPVADPGRVPIEFGADKDFYRAWMARAEIAAADIAALREDAEKYRYLMEKVDAGIAHAIAAARTPKEQT